MSGYGVKIGNQYWSWEDQSDLLGNVLKFVKSDKGGGGSKAFAILFDDGRVEVLGAQERGGDISQVSVDLASDIKDVVGYANGFAALKTDGSVIRWGMYTDLTRHNDLDTQLQSGVDKILSTKIGVLALKEDGSILVWGNDTISDSASYSDSVMSSVENNIEEIYANLLSAVAVKSDGSIISWGDNRFGQGINVSDFSEVSQFVSSSFAFAARFADGSVKVWGSTTDQSNKVDLTYIFDTAEITKIYENAGSFALIDVNKNLYLINDSNKQNDTIEIPVLSDVKKVVSSFEQETSERVFDHYFVLQENGDLKQLDVSLGTENSGFDPSANINHIASDVIDFYFMGHNFVTYEKTDGTLEFEEVDIPVSSISLEDLFGNIISSEVEDFQIGTNRVMLSLDEINWHYEVVANDIHHHNQGAIVNPDGTKKTIISMLPTPEDGSLNHSIMNVSQSGLCHHGRW